MLRSRATFLQLDHTFSDGGAVQIPAFGSLIAISCPYGGMNHVFDIHTCVQFDRVSALSDRAEL